MATGTKACAHCAGEGRVRALVRYSNDCREEIVGCMTCRGSGFIDAEHAERIRAGEALRNDRLARDLSLREEAKRLGISPVELSRREHPAREGE